ncbi:HAD hydrolase family protein [Gammaproteobacteria bacterium]|nr:HAD hydrolase family protein [Gammaproteobacteria bacterium]
MDVFILDVDGVMTTGQFLYDENGKAYKIFGPDDSDGLKVVNKFLQIQFVSADKRGFEISKKRILDDMGYPIELVSSSERLAWIKERYNPLKVIYMGDGFFDYKIMKGVGYSIAPANADINAKECSDFITKRKGGDRAVAEACVHIADKFFDHKEL